MIIKELNNCYRIIADNNKVIINKQKPNQSCVSLTVPAWFDLSLLIEVDNEKINNTLIEQNKPLIESQSLVEAKQSLITYSKSQLANYLENNPLNYNDKYYSVTETAQGRLDSLISAATDAAEMGLDFIPCWNDKDGMREIWSLDELKKLRIAIQQYVLKFVLQQQQIEKRILQTTDVLELYNLPIAYKND